MATTYLNIVNRVLLALNEVTLTSSNFGTADGFCSEVKEHVNAAIFDVYTEEDCRWPWAWTEDTISTVAGTTVYTLASAANTADWHSFRIDADAGNNIDAAHLPLIEHNLYRRKYWPRDDGATSDNYSKPFAVARRPDNKLVVTPVPDQVYSIRYEYYDIPTGLSNHDDTISIPDEYVQLIVDKALHYAYMFRDNTESADRAAGRYKDNVDKVRRIEIPQFHNVIPIG